MEKYGKVGDSYTEQNIGFGLRWSTHYSRMESSRVALARRI